MRSSKHEVISAWIIMADLFLLAVLEQVLAGVPATAGNRHLSPQELLEPLTTMTHPGSKWQKLIPQRIRQYIGHHRQYPTNLFYQRKDLHIGTTCYLLHAAYPLNLFWGFVRPSGIDLGRVQGREGRGKGQLHKQEYLHWQNELVGNRLTSDTILTWAILSLNFI